jgi:Thrombospondin type 3 repeat
LTHPVRRLAPLASAVLIAAACAAPAAAAPGKERAVEPRGTSSCVWDLVSSGAFFAIDTDGEIEEAYPAGFNEDDHDSTWDNAGDLQYRIADDEESDEYDFSSFDNDADCVVEDGGREIAYPGEEIDEDLFLSRKVQVPTAGGYARMYDTVTNRGAVARTVDLAIEANHYSDDEAGIGATSSGDLATTPADSWFTQIDADGDSGSGGYFSGHGTFNFQSPEGSPDRADEVVENLSPIVDRTTRGGGDDDYRYVVFRDITVQPGQTVGYLTAFGQGATVAGTNALAAEIARNKQALLSGLSAAESAALRNWRGDSDGDGALDGGDNCATVANAGQENLDGDGLGDACDDDIDGDGLPNAVEAGFGADPRNVDSDRDGFRDGGDQCPSIAGTANGCPTPAVNVLASTGRALPTGVSLTLSATKSQASASGSKARAAQTGGTLVRASGEIGLPPGVQASACNLGRVAVVVKRGKRTISTRVVDVRPDCSFRSNVRFRRSLGSRVRAKAYFFGSTGLVGRAAKATSAQVK